VELYKKTNLKKFATFLAISIILIILVILNSQIPDFLKNNLNFQTRKIADLSTQKINNQVSAKIKVKEAEIDEIIDKMSIEEKAGQLLVFTAKGTSLSAKYENELKQITPAGVIIMGSNITDQKQLAKFTGEISKTNTIIPPFIAIDQEGGVVKRISWDLTPGQNEWEGLSNDQLCNIGLQRGQILKDAGINLNFSPVVDLKNDHSSAFINNRVISDDPEEVAKISKEYLDCMQSQNIIGTLKHFPGHGATTEDSHYSLPRINKTRDEWMKTDAVPFIKNTQEAEMIMVGHLLFSDLDLVKPASQSPIIISEILRKDLGYKGVVITDDMAQLHTSTDISVKDALKNAYNSDIDLVLYVATQVPHTEIHSTLVNLIETKQIPTDTIDKSLFRIIKLKKEFDLYTT
jgi:beta-N-acetylhexosaminidase